MGYFDPPDKTQSVLLPYRKPAATNNNCNGSGPHVAGEVRLMPHSNEPLHGNDILCRACWNRALSYRRKRNRTLGEFARFDLPRWEDAKVYDAGE